MAIQDVDHKYFENCISSCDLNKMQFKGSSFTWWNGKADSDCIFESLSRIPYNQEMQGWFNYMEVEHLDGTG